MTRLAPTLTPVIDRIDAAAARLAALVREAQDDRQPEPVKQTRH